MYKKKRIFNSINSRLVVERVHSVKRYKVCPVFTNTSSVVLKQIYKIYGNNTIIQRLLVNMFLERLLISERAWEFQSIIVTPCIKQFDVALLCLVGNDVYLSAIAVWENLSSTSCIGLILTC